MSIYFEFLKIKPPDAQGGSIYIRARVVLCGRLCLCIRKEGQDLEGFFVWYAYDNCDPFRYYG